MIDVEEKDWIRALVLRAFYDVNEQMPGNAEQTGVIADRTVLPKPDVDRATIYLSERNLISIHENEGFLGSTDRLIMAAITSYGVDVIERPEERGPDYLDRGVVQQITIVNGTHVAAGGVAHNINQQVVGRDNRGVMVNASTTGDIQPPTTPFPIEKLRELLPDGSLERNAAEELAGESRSPRPRMSRVSGAIEMLKNLTKIPGAVTAVSDWLKTPDVGAWIHHVADLLH